MGQPHLGEQVWGPEAGVGPGLKMGWVVGTQLKFWGEVGLGVVWDSRRVGVFGVIQSWDRKVWMDSGGRRGA